MIDYAAIQALNWSTLKHMAVSPLYFRFRQTTPAPDTDAFRIGRALHCSILEPERWARDYVAAPEFGDLRFKENKAAKADWLASNTGREVLSAAEWTDITRAGEAVRAHRVAGKLISGWRNEEIIQWIDKSSGIACKGRVDHFGLGFLVDLKKARDVEGFRFSRNAAGYLYHGQLAWYHDGAIRAGVLPADAERPILVSVQTEAPYDVACDRLSQRTLDAGRALYRRLVTRLVECQAADMWPGCAPDLREWELPEWAVGGADAESDGGEW